MLFYLTAALVTIIDQLLKLAAQSFLPGQPVPLIGIVKLSYTQNTGAAFSLFTGFSGYLAVIGLVVAASIIYFQRRLKFNDYWLQFGLAFILGGSLGNLLDRLLHGFVIDYIDLTYWPVFNLADVMINLGVLLIVIKLLFKEDRHVSNTL
jgi:signal peptidase II